MSILHALLLIWLSSTDGMTYVCYSNRRQKVDSVLVKGKCQLDLTFRVPDAELNLFSLPPCVTLFHKHTKIYLRKLNKNGAMFESYQTTAQTSHMLCCTTGIRKGGFRTLTKSSEQWCWPHDMTHWSLCFSAQTDLTRSTQWWPQRSLVSLSQSKTEKGDFKPKLLAIASANY